MSRNSSHYRKLSAGGAKAGVLDAGWLADIVRRLALVAAREQPGKSGASGGESARGPGDVEQALKRATFLQLAAVASETALGVASGSPALLADAAHGLLDSVAYLTGWMGAAQARRPAGLNATSGWGRAEGVAAAANAIGLLGVVAAVTVEAVHHLLSASPVNGILEAVGALSGVAVNLAVALGLRHGEGANAKAAMQHAMADMRNSAGVMVAGVLGAGLAHVVLPAPFGFIVPAVTRYLDPVISLVIAGAIARQGIPLVRQTVAALAGETPPSVEVANLVHDARSVEGVINVGAVHVDADGDGNPRLAMRVQVADFDSWPSVRTRLCDVLRDRFSVQPTTLEPTLLHPGPVVEQPPPRGRRLHYGHGHGHGHGRGHGGSGHDVHTHVTPPRTTGLHLPSDDHTHVAPPPRAIGLHLPPDRTVHRPPDTSGHPADSATPPETLRVAGAVDRLGGVFALPPRFRASFAAATRRAILGRLAALAPGRRLRLQGDLRGVRLSAGPGASPVDLRGLDLPRIPIAGTDFRCAILEGSDLRGADGVAGWRRLRDPRLAPARFDQARMAGSCLDEASLAGTSFRGTDLSGCSARYGELPGADLHAAVLKESDVSHALLDGANLGGASAPGMRARYASLRGADLRGADLRHADLRNADLRDAKLRGCRLRDCDLRGAWLSPGVADAALRAGALVDQNARRLIVVSRFCRGEATL